MNKLLTVLLALCVFSATAGAAGEKLLIHEWGTFTAIQDEQGNALGGINSDDESLPSFVKNVSYGIISTPDMKGLGVIHPEVTLRLETPVVYFHPPASMKSPFTLDFEVGLKRGWLTQYYPDADAVAPGLKGIKNGEPFGSLTPKTLGTLAWRGLTIGGEEFGPKTKLRNWTAPREVKAVSVKTPGGDSERFLFYRGIAQLNAPIRVSRNSQDLSLSGQSEIAYENGMPMNVPILWLADFRKDGTCAFRTLPSINVGNDPKKVLLNTPATFEESQYSKGTLASLRKSMHEWLVKDGMYADEADALLNTWDSSYFRTTGLRLFYLVPQVWTNAYLPIKVSTPSTIVRSMVGRIEIITPEQRSALREITTSDPTIDDAENKLWKSYQGLGRFRNAILTDEAKRNTSPGLKKFMKNYGLATAKTTAQVQAPVAPPASAIEPAQKKDEF